MLFRSATGVTGATGSAGASGATGPQGAPGLTLVKTVTTDYTITTTDQGYLIRFNNSSSANVTLVSDATEAIPIGTTVVVGRVSSGSVTIVAGSGATVYTPASYVVAKQWAKVTIIKTAVNTWEIDGNLSP